MIISCQSLSTRVSQAIFTASMLQNLSLKSCHSIPNFPWVVVVIVVKIKNWVLFGHGGQNRAYISIVLNHYFPLNWISENFVVGRDRCIPCLPSFYMHCFYSIFIFPSQHHYPPVIYAIDISEASLTLPSFSSSLLTLTHPQTH